jgi:SAM-dependent methyltransferase
MTKTKGLYRELVRKYRQVGFWRMIKHALLKVARNTRALVFPHPATEDPFDPKYGTDTAGIIGVGSLDIPENEMEHSMHYGPIGEEEFSNTLKNLPIKCEELLFIDIGSGKGRALLLASLFPFKKIIGVELSAMLHHAAVRNIDIFKDERQKCRDIHAICENASTFNIPEEPTLFYLANPFDDEVMHLVVSHIRDSFKKYPRKIYIWYLKPCYRTALDGAGFLRIIRDTGRYVFYESEPITPNH